MYVDKPTEEQVGNMFQVASGKLFNLTENKRAETLSWHSTVPYVLTTGMIDLKRTDIRE